MTTITTGTDHLLASVEDGVAVLTLNRPERRNALSSDMLAALASALDQADASPDVGAVVLTGAGGAFCAGGDVKGMASGGDTGGSRTGGIDERIAAQRLSQRNTAGRIFTMPKPVVAALPGPAAGAGLSIALAADLRVMAAETIITTAFARVGFSGDYGGTFFLTHLVGTAKARELYYLSEKVTAEECLRLGIVNRVVPQAEVLDSAVELARRLANGPTVAYRYMKENLNRAAMGGEVMDCLDLEATHHVHTGLTEDHREAAKAFVEKREPVFRGR